MNLTEHEIGVLQWAIKTARESVPFSSEDPYANVMLLELLDECEKEVNTLEPNNMKYVVAK